MASKNSLLGYIGKAACDVPPPFRTISQWAALEELSASRARHVLEAGVRDGFLVEKTFTVRTGGGTKATKHYARTDELAAYEKKAKK